MLQWVEICLNGSEDQDFGDTEDEGSIEQEQVVSKRSRLAGQVQLEEPNPQAQTIIPEIEEYRVALCH